DTGEFSGRRHLEQNAIPRVIFRGGPDVAVGALNEGVAQREAIRINGELGDFAGGSDFADVVIGVVNKPEGSASASGKRAGAGVLREGEFGDVTGRRDAGDLVGVA